MINGNTHTRAVILCVTQSANCWEAKKTTNRAKLHILSIEDEAGQRRVSLSQRSEIARHSLIYFTSLARRERPFTRKQRTFPRFPHLQKCAKAQDYASSHQRSSRPRFSGACPECAICRLCLSSSDAESLLYVRSFRWDAAMKKRALRFMWCILSCVRLSAPLSTENCHESWKWATVIA